MPDEAMEKRPPSPANGPRRRCGAPAESRSRPARPVGGPARCGPDRDADVTRRQAADATRRPAIVRSAQVEDRGPGARGGHGRRVVPRGRG